MNDEELARLNKRLSTSYWLPNREPCPKCGLTSLCDGSLCSMPNSGRVPMMALTPELQEAIETAALAYSEFCGIASDECNKHVRIISEAIAAAQRDAKK